MSSSARGSSGHADINERRLRPIYDCLDNGNNKKAIQEADRILKKQKDLPCAKVLKCLALIRLGRQDETLSLLQAVHQQLPSDESTLQAMSMCYRELYKLDLLADMYERAHKVKPDNEEILNHLFNAYVRLGNYKKQQQIAMVLHKLRPLKNPYYFWAVMSIFMQAHENKQLGRTMFLPLAEKMTLKYLHEGKLEAEAEVRLYLIILQSMEKYEEALEVIRGPLAAKLTTELNFVQFLEVDLLIELQRWPYVNYACRKLLLKNPDQWKCYKDYFHSAFILIDSGWTPDDNENLSAEDVDSSVEKIAEFLTSTMKKVSTELEELRSGDNSSPSYAIRGPLLAKLEMTKMLKERSDPNWNNVFGQTPESLIQEYYNQFGDKPSCFHDLKLYFRLLKPDEQQAFLNKSTSDLCLQGADGKLNFLDNTKSLQRHILLLQLYRFTGFVDQMSVEQQLNVVDEIIQRYTDGLRFGEKLTSTDFQFVDNYIVLSVHLLLDVARRSENDKYIVDAIVQLEKALKKSPSNFQMKLLLIQLYSKIGAFKQCLAMYESLEIKHIQHDALGMPRGLLELQEQQVRSLPLREMAQVDSSWAKVKSLGRLEDDGTNPCKYFVSNHVVRLGHNSSANVLYDSMLKFFASVHKDTSDYLISSYKYGSFPKVQEFVEFRERLQNSLQFASATTEKLLLDLTGSTASHKMAVEAVLGTGIDQPHIEKVDFESLKDNRDFHVMLDWNPIARTFNDELKKRCFEEEKLWLHLRNLTVRCILAAVKLGQETQEHAISNNLGNGDDASRNVDNMINLTTELQQLLGRCSDNELISVDQYPITGPFRTRLCSYLRLGLGKCFLQYLDFLLHVEATVDEQSSAEKVEKKLPVENLAQDICDFVQKNRKPLLEFNGDKARFNVDALENLVLLTEHISHATVLMGCCHQILKPTKSALNKKGKKRREISSELTNALEVFSRSLVQLTDLAKDLEGVFGEIIPTPDLVSQLASTTLNGHEDSDIDYSLETEVRNKIEESFRQTSSQMTSVLLHKQQYLKSLQL